MPSFVHIFTHKFIETINFYNKILNKLDRYPLFYQNKLVLNCSASLFLTRRAVTLERNSFHDNKKTYFVLVCQTGPGYLV